jgi:Fe-S oxidoreductase
MCVDNKNIIKNQFVQHNIFFLSWLLSSKKEIKISKNKNVFIITNIDSETYKLYKKEYKEHRKLLKDIKSNLKYLEKI